MNDVQPVFAFLADENPLAVDGVQDGQRQFKLQRELKINKQVISLTIRICLYNALRSRR